MEHQPFEIVLAIVAIIALIGAAIFVFKALMRPWVAVAAIGLLGWLLYIQTILEKTN
jgi:hypothetical protein